MTQLESRVMIQGKQTQVTWEKKEVCRRKVLLSDLELFLISSVYHPSLNKTPSPVFFFFVNPPLQVFNQSKASRASKQLSNFKTHLLSSSQTLGLCPKGTILYTRCCLVPSPAEWWDIKPSVHRQQGICLWANPPVPAIKERQEHTHWGHSIKGSCPQANPALQDAHPDLQSNEQQWRTLAKSCAAPFIHKCSKQHILPALNRGKKPAFY